MAAEEMPTSQENVPYFEDIIVETGHKRAEWIVGRNNLLAECQCGPGRFDEAIKTHAFPYRIVKRGDGLHGMPMFVFWRGDLEAIKRVLVPPPPPAPRVTEKLPAVAILAPRPQDVPSFINQATPFLAREDADAIKMSMWGVKNSVDVLTRATNNLASAVGTLSADVAANTKAVQEQTEAMRNIFEGEKK